MVQCEAKIAGRRKRTGKNAETQREKGCAMKERDDRTKMGDICEVARVEREKEGRDRETASVCMYGCK
jgi:hypothetical protein